MNEVPVFFQGDPRVAPSGHRLLDPNPDQPHTLVPLGVRVEHVLLSGGTSGVRVELVETTGPAQVVRFDRAAYAGTRSRRRAARGR